MPIPSKGNPTDPLASPTRKSLLDASYLWYLTLLPAAGTFGALVSGDAVFGPWSMLWIIFGGVAIAIYLTFMMSYVGLPRSTIGKLSVFLNTPLAVLISSLLYDGSVWETLAIMLTLEVLPVYVAFALLSILNRRSPLAMHIALWLLMAIVSAAILNLTWHSFFKSISGNLYNGIILSVSLIIRVYINFRLVKNNSIIKDRCQDENVIIVGSLSWIGIVFLFFILQDFSIL